MWTIIRQYYLFLFLTFLALFTLQVLMTDSPNTALENALVVVVGALAISLFCGTIYYLMDTKWGPKKRQKMMEKPPFTDLMGMGFERKEDFVTGVVGNYTVIVSYTWQTGKSAITPTVTFHPKRDGHFHEREELRELMKRYSRSNASTAAEYQWTRLSVGQPMEYNFKPPSYEKVMETIYRLIDILQTEGLHPITYEESDRLLPELLEDIERKKELPELN